MIGICNYGCACNQCWDHGSDCGHDKGTCARTPRESFNEALAAGRVAVIDSLDDD